MAAVVCAACADAVDVDAAALLVGCGEAVWLLSVWERLAASSRAVWRMRWMRSSVDGSTAIMSGVAVAWREVRGEVRAAIRCEGSGGCGIERERRKGEERKGKRKRKRKREAGSGGCVGL